MRPVIGIASEVRRIIELQRAPPIYLAVIPFSRLPEECYCSQVYGRPSREYLLALRFGAPARISVIRGALSCLEPSVPPCPCSDRAPGPSMPAFLDGSA